MTSTVRKVYAMSDKAGSGETLRLVHRQQDSNRAEMVFKRRQELRLTFPSGNSAYREMEKIAIASILRNENRIPYHCPGVDVAEFVEWFKRRHPELFWIANSYSIQSFSFGKPLSIIIETVDQISDRQKYDEIVRRSVEEIVVASNRRSSIFDKLKYVYDWFCQHYTYSNTKLHHDYTVVGVFRDHRAVCSGLSKAFMLVCMKMDIPCGIISGNTTIEPEITHAWNAVKINGAIYHIDVTAGINFYESYHQIGYPFFLLPESEIKLSRYIQTPTMMRESTEYKYTKRMRQCFDTSAEMSRWFANHHGIATIGGNPSSWRSNQEFQDEVRRCLQRQLGAKTITTVPYGHYCTIVDLVR